MLKKSKNNKRLLKATSAVFLATSAIAIPAVAQASGFKDINASQYFYNDVLELNERGIIGGFSDGTFKPGSHLTRGQAAKIIAGVLGLDTVNVINPNFKDIPETHQYYGAIAALKQAGIIGGYEDDTFRQGDKIQRNHVAKMLANALNLKATNVDGLPFTDVRADYKDAIAALYENNVTTGKTATTFDGTANVTRGQMAAFVVRAEKAAQQDQTQALSFEVTEYSVDGISIDGKLYQYNASVKSIFTEANKAALEGATIKATAKNGVISSVNELTFNNSGSADAVKSFDAKTTIDTLTINADYVEVKNINVTGNAIITNKVTSEVLLDNVTIAGELIVDEALVGAVASLDNKFANTTENALKVKLKNSKAGNVLIKRNGTSIESDSAISSMTLSARVSLVNIDGTVTTLTIESTSNLELTGNANVGQILLETAVDLALKIAGVIEKLTVSNSNARIALDTNVKINELALPAGTTASGIVANFAQIASQIATIVIGSTISEIPNTGGSTGNSGGNDGGSGSGGSGGSDGGSGVDPETPVVPENPDTPDETTSDTAVVAVDKLIEALPTVESLTLAHEDQVVAARTAYNALTDAQQSLVKSESVAKLNALELKIEELKGQNPETTPDTAVVSVVALETSRETSVGTGVNLPSELGVTITFEDGSTEEKLVPVKWLEEIPVDNVGNGTVAGQLTVYGVSYPVEFNYTVNPFEITSSEAITGLPTTIDTATIGFTTADTAEIGVENVEGKLKISILDSATLSSLEAGNEFTITINNIKYIGKYENNVLTINTP